MRQGHASRTAEYVAFFRALESARPEAERLFCDPFARAFLGRHLALLARLAGLPGLRALVPWLVDRRVAGSRSSAVARTRYIDAALAAALPSGMEQLVILGAGFDCRAYRLPALGECSVFEVDHPDTQADKRRKLARVLPAVPANVRFVSTDFSAGELPAVMAAAGYRETARSFFLWEGVTNYLSEPAVDATLRWCARAAPGSRLLFTYVHRNVLLRPESFVGTAALFASLERFGERWTFGIDPAELPGFLAARGLALEADVGASEYRRLAYGDAARHMRGYEFYRIAQARVGAPAHA
jgi:methyltransferase (TIGR00027 family)